MHKKQKSEQAYEPKKASATMSPRAQEREPKRGLKSDPKPTIQQVSVPDLKQEIDVEKKEEKEEYVEEASQSR